MKRLSWEEYALRLAETAKLRSEDPYIKVGSCALRFDHSIAGLGYNGAPPNVNIEWSDRDERRKRVIHAEVNCLKFCKPGEIWLIATSISPCSDCIKQIAAFGIKKVVFKDFYNRDLEAINLGIEFGINFDVIKDLQ